MPLQYHSVVDLVNFDGFMVRLLLLFVWLFGWRLPIGSPRRRKSVCCEGKCHGVVDTGKRPKRGQNKPAGNRGKTNKPKRARQA